MPKCPKCLPVSPGWVLPSQSSFPYLIWYPRILRSEVCRIASSQCLARPSLGLIPLCLQTCDIDGLLVAGMMCSSKQISQRATTGLMPWRSMRPGLAVLEGMGCCAMLAQA